MISQEEIAFCVKLRDDIAQHPEWLLSAMQAINSGMEKRFDQQRHEAVEWEIIAANAMETRLFRTNQSWLADKIERLKDTASCRWDHIIEKLRKH